MFNDINLIAPLLKWPAGGARGVREGGGEGAGGRALKCPHTALIKSKCKNSKQKLKENCDKELVRPAAGQRSGGRSAGDAGARELWLMILQWFNERLE